MITCLFASYWSLRFAAADYFYRENTLEALRRSVELAPGNAAYWSLLAEQAESAGLNPDADLLRASALSPLDARYLIRLGFRSEVEHNFPQAEKYLLQAADADHQFDPRWALMSFYFRRGNIPEFWRWTDRAFELSYGDRSAMFKLVWNVGADPETIRAHIPHTPDIQFAYLGYLVFNKHLEASIPIAEEVAAGSTDRDTDVLLNWWDNIFTLDPSAALVVWNQLCQRRLLPYPPLDPSTGKIVTNGDFTHATVQRGSDWRLSSLDSLSVRIDPFAHELTVRFDGKEPEDLVIAEQWMPVDLGLRYRIRSGSSPTSGHVPGVFWTVSGAHDQALAHSENTDSVEFDPAQNLYVRLSLCYKRPLGSTRAEGTLTIRNVSGEVIRK